MKSLYTKVREADIVVHFNADETVTVLKNRGGLGGTFSVSEYNAEMERYATPPEKIIEVTADERDKIMTGKY